MQTQQSPYNLRDSTKIKTLISKLNITEAQAYSVMHNLAGLLVRPAPKGVSWDIEICWYGQWTKAEIKAPTNVIVMQPGGRIRDGPNILSLNAIKNTI